MGQRFPETLRDALQPVTVVAGHYGSGKTNFSVNLAVDLADEGAKVAVIDLDIVNPYFRATEQRQLLDEHGVELVAPVFSEVGTSLDVPSLTGRITPTIRDYGENAYVIIDAGGDDAGATALGRFSKDIVARGYAMFYVANRFRNLVQDPADALENLREIEAASRLNATAIVNNSHLKSATNAEAIAEGLEYAKEISSVMALPIVCTTVPSGVSVDNLAGLYRVEPYVKTPWE